MRPDHAAYIDSRLKVLKGDKRFVFTAAAQAQRAADYLHGLQSPQEAQTAAQQSYEATCMHVYDYTALRVTVSAMRLLSRMAARSTPSPPLPRRCRLTETPIRGNVYTLKQA